MARNSTICGNGCDGLGGGGEDFIFSAVLRMKMLRKRCFTKNNDELKVTNFVEFKYIRD